MNPGVIYFLRGKSHNLMALVSIHALRKVYAGSVALLTDELAGPVADICADVRLKVQHSPLEICERRRNSAHTTKTWIHRYSPFDPTIFIDADTIPVADPSGIFPTLEEEVTWTKFGTWRVCGTPYEKRMFRFLETAGSQTLLGRVMKENRPAINTGVFAFWKHAKALEPIHAICLRAFNVFIPDECAAQALYGEYPHRLADDRWNESPRHGTTKEQAIIWHCHGSRMLHRQTRRLWLGLLAEVVADNLGNVREWIASDGYWQGITASEPELKSLLC